MPAAAFDLCRVVARDPVGGGFGLAAERNSWIGRGCCGFPAPPVDSWCRGVLTRHLLGQRDEGPDTEAGATLDDVTVITRSPGRTGDVEMDPWPVVYELLEQVSRGDGPSPSRSRVLHVGNVAIDLAAIVVG